jgi:hypothetical protein
MKVRLNGIASSVGLSVSRLNFCFYFCLNFTFPRGQWLRNFLFFVAAIGEGYNSVSEKGYFGPWKVCQELLYGREKCGSSVGASIVSFRPIGKFLHFIYSFWLQLDIY